MMLHDIALSRGSGQWFEESTISFRARAALAVRRAETRETATLAYYKEVHL